VPAPEIAFVVLDGREAARHADDFAAAAAEVYADPPYGWGDHEAAEFARRFAVQARQPGFVLAEARHGGYLVGYGFGMPLRPATSWWRHLTTPLPEEMTTEYQGRTFALADLAVRAAWRRQGIGTTLYGLIMAKRPEERATLTVLPSAGPAQNAYQRWGWSKIARTRDAGLSSAVLDVLILTLPAGLG
jgi:ribosomal protein S18 acetylase RimI-like enzyme